jgi:N-sulfoglucosamine sulfohydrolase
MHRALSGIAARRWNAVPYGALVRLVLVAFCITLPVAWPAVAVPRRPNIVLIHCHDLGQHLHCYGVKTVRTPNLDALASQGVRFARSFCTAPGCSPSRASIFTGRLPHSNGAMGLCHANFGWDLNPNERHLAQILHDAGYTTAAIGTVHETSAGPKRCGYERYFIQCAAEPATDAAIRLLQEWHDQPARPFFLSVGFSEPHRHNYPRPTWPGALPGDASFPGPHLQADASLGIEVPGYLRDTEGTRRELAGLQGAIHHVDTQVGRLLAALKESGLENNTLVIFTTDHGIAMPRAKCSLYEPGVQVAFLLRLPSRKGWHGGGVHNEMISNIDYLPTILDLAGVPIAANVQGRSFASLLDGRRYEPRREIFTELTYHDYYDPRRAIRTATHKLIVNFTTAPAFMDPSQSWRPPSDVATPPNVAGSFHPYLELYDLEHDPWEQRDLAQSPTSMLIRADLLNRLARHMQETEDPLLRGAVTSPQHRRAINLLDQALLLDHVLPLRQ